MKTDRKPTRLPVLLALSVAVNLLLIGGFIGNMFAPKSDRSDIMETLNTPGKHRTAKREDMQAVRAQLREAWRASAPARQEHQTARAALATQLKATPYDEAAVREAFSEMRAAETRLQAATHAELAPALSNMSPERRAALADLMLRRRRGDRSPRVRGRRGRPPQD